MNAEQSTTQSVRPKVTIIIPAFNAGAFIFETLESLKNQTLKEFEAIIVDDKSTDNTTAIAGEFIKHDDRFKLIKNIHKRGVAGARNSGLDIASSNWVCFLDSDDLLDKNSLWERVQVGKSYSGAEFITGDLKDYFSEEKNPGPAYSQTKAGWNIYQDAPISIHPKIINNPLLNFLYSVPVHTATVMIKKEILIKLGGFNESLKTNEDDHLWIRVAASVNMLYFTKRSISYYRQRLGSLTKSTLSLHHNAPAAYKLLLRDPLLKDHHQAITRNIVNFRHANTYFYRKKGSKLQALISAFLAIRDDKLSRTSWKNLIAACLFR